MLLRPILGNIRHVVASLTPPKCNARTSIKLNEEYIELNVDIRPFKKSEISVKAHERYVRIEGRQTATHSKGYIIREFSRKYRLPDGCDMKTLKPTLSADGILTITATRTDKGDDIVDEVSLKIKDVTVKDEASTSGETKPDKPEPDKPEPDKPENLCSKFGLKVSKRK